MYSVKKKFQNFFSKFSKNFFKIYIFGFDLVKNNLENHSETGKNRYRNSKCWTNYIRKTKIYIYKYKLKVWLILEPKNSEFELNTVENRNYNLLWNEHDVIILGFFLG